MKRIITSLTALLLLTSVAMAKKGGYKAVKTKVTVSNNGSSAGTNSNIIAGKISAPMTLTLTAEQLKAENERLKSELRTLNSMIEQLQERYEYVVTMSAAIYMMQQELAKHQTQSGS